MAPDIATGREVREKPQQKRCPGQLTLCQASILFFQESKGGVLLAAIGNEPQESTLEAPHATARSAKAPGVQQKPEKLRERAEAEEVPRRRLWQRTSHQRQLPASCWQCWIPRPTCRRAPNDSMFLVPFLAPSVDIKLNLKPLWHLTHRHIPLRPSLVLVPLALSVGGSCLRTGCPRAGPSNGPHKYLEHRPLRAGVGRSRNRWRTSLLPITKGRAGLLRETGRESPATPLPRLHGRTNFL